MSETVQAILTGFFILSASMWIGGFIAIVVVARIASATLQPASRVAFFRSLGRTYGIVGTTALLVALGTGAGLATNLSWSATLAAAIGVAAAVLLSLIVGMLQARRMTHLRRRLLAEPEDRLLVQQVQRGARRAGILRAGIGVLTFALIALGSLLAA